MICHLIFQVFTETTCIKHTKLQWKKRGYGVSITIDVNNVL